MAAHSSKGEAAREIAGLTELDREELLARWRAAFPGPVPSHLSRPVMVRALAYEIQASLHGGLPAHTVRALKTAQRSNAAAAPVPAGSRLVREWNGRTHVIDVTDDGFIWNAQRFTSLSAIAREITGAHWSGPRFFGIRRKGALR